MGERKAPNNMQAIENSAHELGRLLMTPLYASFAGNSSMTTSDGGRLFFRSDHKHDPADGLPEVRAVCLAAVSPIPRRGSEDNGLFALTTAVADEAGCLWQRVRTVNTDEIWRTILARREFYQFEAVPSDCLAYRNLDNLKSVTRRVLFEPEETLCDMRERHVVEVIRKEQQNQRNSSSSRVRFAETERLIFRLHFKYFTAAIGLLEERCVFSPAKIQPPFYDELVITVRPSKNPKSIVAVHGNDDEVVLPLSPIGFAELGTLCIRQAILSTGWEKPAKELPTAGDVALWQEKYRELGIAPESIFAFKPNPAIHYEPISKC